MAFKTVPGGTTASKSTRGVLVAQCLLSQIQEVFTPTLRDNLRIPRFPMRDGDSSIGDPVNLLQVRQMGRVPIWLRLQGEHQHWKGLSVSLLQWKGFFQQKRIFTIRVKKCWKITQQTSCKKFIGGGEQKAASEQGWKTETYWVAMVGFREGMEHAHRKILPVTRETQVCWSLKAGGTLVLECGRFLAD